MWMSHNLFNQCLIIVFRLFHNFIHNKKCCDGHLYSYVFINILEDDYFVRKNKFFVKVTVFEL